MAGEPAGAKRQSKLIGWKNAVAACNEVWDAFEEAAVVATDAKIKVLELGGILKGVTWNQAGPPKQGTEDMGAGQQEQALRMQAIEELRRCVANLKTMFAGWRARSLAELEKGLLKQKSRGMVVGVWTRHVSKIPPHRRFTPAEDGHRQRKRGRKASGRRSHHKGKYKLTHPRNHVRGRPLLNFRQKRERDRRVAAASHAERKATRIMRLLKGWKPYVRRKPGAE